MQWRRVLGILGVVACSLLFASISHAQCRKDTDCKGERVCEQGACVTSSAALPPAPAPPPDAAATAGTTTGSATAPPGAAADGSHVAPRDLSGTGDAPARVDATPDAKPQMVRHSTGMMAGGIVMVSFVPIALLVAMVANLQQSVCEVGTYSSSDGFASVRSDCSRFDKTIYGGLLGAAALAGVGIPLIVIGAKKEPVGTAQLAPWATPQAAGLALRVDL